MKLIYFSFIPLSLAVAAGSVFGQGQKPAVDGITEAVFEVTLSFPDPGIIAAQNFKEGDFVSTNDVIIQLDSGLEQLEADRRRLVMENRASEWEATKAVFDKSISVSREELQKKEAEYNVARVEYQIAVEQLRRRSLHAPRPGVIAEIKLHPGEACIAYQPVVRVVDTRKCYFVSHLDASQSAGLKSGQPVDLQINDLKTNRIEGTVVFVSPVVDPASGLQKVRVVFDNDDGRIRPGREGQMFLR